MVSWQHSIMTRLTAAFIILILIISGLSVMYTYDATQSALKETTREELIGLASVIASQVDGDVLQSFQEGDEDSAAFLSIRDKLYTMQESNPDIRYLYTMRRLGDDVAFVVDAEYGITEGTAGINEIYESPTVEMYDGFISPISESEFTTDEWGTVLSGYAPVHDSAGDVVGIVGVDMSADRVIERLNFIGNIIFIIMLIGILLTGIIIAYFSKTMIRDIRSLNDSASRISTGDMDVIVKVDRKDEIGELADSFSRMVSSLKIMMMEDEP